MVCVVNAEMGLALLSTWAYTADSHWAYSPQVIQIPFTSAFFLKPKLIFWAHYTYEWDLVMEPSTDYMKKWKFLYLFNLERNSASTA